MAKPKIPDYGVIGVSEPLSQSESHRLGQLLPVLWYIQTNHEFSAKQLEKETGVSRDSIDRTLRVLEKSDIIGLKERRARGEKFYKIKSKSKFDSYLNRMDSWNASKITLKSVTKDAPKLKKIMTRGIKRAMFRERFLSKRDKSKPLWFISKKRQEQITPKIPYPNPVIIWDLPNSQAFKIIDSYYDRLLCQICFDDNKISFLNRETDELVCEQGHVTDLPDIEIDAESEKFTYNQPIRKRGKRISDYDMEEQKEEYL